MIAKNSWKMILMLSRSKWLLQKLLALFVLVLIPNALHGEEAGPSKEDTLRFIQDRAKACTLSVRDVIGSTMPVESSEKYTLKVDVENDTLKTTVHAVQNLAWFAKGQIVSEATATVPLRELKATALLGNSNVTLACYEGECFSFKYNILSFSIESAQLVPQIARFKPNGKQRARINSYSFCDSDDAGRVARAFERLILLHGGKKMLF